MITQLNEFLTSTDFDCIVQTTLPIVAWPKLNFQKDNVVDQVHLRREVYVHIGSSGR